MPQKQFQKINISKARESVHQTRWQKPSNPHCCFSALLTVAYTVELEMRREKKQTRTARKDRRRHQREADGREEGSEEGRKLCPSLSPFFLLVSGHLFVVTLQALCSVLRTHADMVGASHSSKGGRHQPTKHQINKSYRLPQTLSRKCPRFQEKA